MTFISKLLQRISAAVPPHLQLLFRHSNRSELVSDRKASVYVIPFKLEADGAAIFFTICPVFAFNWHANGSIFHARPGATLRGEPHSSLPARGSLLIRTRSPGVSSAVEVRTLTHTLHSECSSSTRAL